MSLRAGFKSAGIAKQPDCLNPGSAVAPHLCHNAVPQSVKHKSFSTVGPLGKDPRHVPLRMNLSISKELWQFATFRDLP